MNQPDPRQLQRIRYLQEMGIVSWYPRSRLPGALPSEVVDWHFEKQQNKAARSGQADKAAPAAGRPGETRLANATEKMRSVRHVLSDEAVKTSPLPQSLAPQKAAAAMVTEGASPDVALHFRMQFYAIDESLGFICHQPALAAADLGKREQILLDNILLWLSKTRDPEAVSRSFRWPIPGINQADTALAGSSLLAFLQQTASEKPFATLVFMGETILDALQTELSGNNASWNLIVTPGLTEMLNLPSLKRETWQKLVPLKSVIDTGKR